MARRKVDSNLRSNENNEREGLVELEGGSRCNETVGDELLDVRRRKKDSWILTTELHSTGDEIFRGGEGDLGEEGRRKEVMVSIETETRRDREEGCD